MYMLNRLAIWVIQGILYSTETGLGIVWQSLQIPHNQAMHKVSPTLVSKQPALACGWKWKK